MAHILPDSDRNYRMASPPPSCPHGTSYAQPCYGCGWACPTCGRNYAPWVRECNYKHEENWQECMGVVSGTFGPILPVPTPATALQLALPAPWGAPGYQHFFRADGEWREIIPGLQVLLGQPFRDGEEAILHFRLTPAAGPSEPAT